jgi:hypothetical protein
MTLVMRGETAQSQSRGSNCGSDKTNETDTDREA